MIAHFTWSGLNLNELLVLEGTSIVHHSHGATSTTGFVGTNGWFFDATPINDMFFATGTHRAFKIGCERREKTKVTKIVFFFVCTHLKNKNR
jgi:hypothetical protein